MTQRLLRCNGVSEALIITALALLPLLFWWRLWALDPADRAAIPSGDFTSQYYPLQLFAARELAAGRLPAWDPYLNAGQPGLADIQTGVFYPLNLAPNLFLALLGLPLTVGVLTAQVILHYSLASVFTYVLVRHLARRVGARRAAARFAGSVAALTFTYAGYLTSFPVQQLTILETAVWLPLVLYALDQALLSPQAGGELGRRRWPVAYILLGGVSLACALLAGHPQTAMYVVYATMAYGLSQWWPSRSQRRVSGMAFHSSRLIPLIVIILLGFALAAVQLVPTLTFISRSTRTGLDYDAVSWGFPLAETTHFLYPGYFGSSPQYVGILSPILAAAALLVKRARRQVIFWVGLASVSLLLAFGGNTFLYSVFYLLAPGFGAVRNQERAIYLFVFAVSVLAGLGALVLVQPLPRHARAALARFRRGLGWFFVVLLTLTALFYFGYLQGLQQGVEINMFEGVLRHHTLILLILAGSVAVFSLRIRLPASRGRLVSLTLGLIALNLFTINWRFNLAQPVPGGAFPETGLVRFLKEQPGIYRISSAGLLPGGSSAAVVHQLEDITANTPMRLDAFQQLEDRVESWRLWQLLNVHYILDQRDVDSAGLARVFEEGAVKAYRIQDPLPRAWVVHDLVISDDDRAVALLNAPEFDPRASAVIPPGTGLQTPSGAAETGTPSERGSCQVVSASPGRLTLDVTTVEPGLLVISQPFYPGWRATIDGERVSVYRVDFLLQGIPVDAGTRRVQLTYRNSAWPAVLSLAVLLACLAAWIWARRP